MHKFEPNIFNCIASQVEEVCVAVSGVVVLVRWRSFVRRVNILWWGTVGILLVGTGLEVGRIMCWVRRPVRILVRLILWVNSKG